MPVLIDVEFTVARCPSVHPSGEPTTRPVPGACATCRRCGHTATVERTPAAADHHGRAAGYRSLRDLAQAAIDELRATCPRTTGPDAVQSWPNRYVVSQLPRGVAVHVRYLDRWLPAELYDRTLMTTVGPVARDHAVRLFAPKGETESIREAVTILERCGYAADLIIVRPTDPVLAAVAEVQPAAPPRPSAPPSAVATA